MATAEELQTLVLTTLERESSIPDSKDLKTVNGDTLDQLALLGVLNSLKSKEVCSLSLPKDMLSLAFYQSATDPPSCMGRRCLTMSPSTARSGL